MFGMVKRMHTLPGGRRVFDVRGEGGEVYAGCDAILGGPQDGVAWANVRVALALTEAGRVLVLGPTGEGNAAFTKATPQYDDAAEHPGQFGEEDKVIEHNGIRLVFGKSPNDLLIEVPGILRIAASTIRFSKSGVTGERVVMWGPLVTWGTSVVERVNAHDAWIMDYQAKLIASPLTPPVPTPPLVPTEVEAPTAAMASGTISIPEEDAT